MPRQKLCPMDPRMRFVNAVLAAEDNLTVLCEESGISRRIRYKWPTSL